MLGGISLQLTEQNERKSGAKRAQIHAKKRKRAQIKKTPQSEQLISLQKYPCERFCLKRTEKLIRSVKQRPEQKKNVAQICATMEVPGLQ